MAKKILLVEDEKSIAEGIIYNLKNEGMRVTHVDEGPIALDLFEEEHFDLVILDIMLPEISGLDICRSIRKTSNVPIIMVTARDDEVDKITGLEIGADDYIQVWGYSFAGNSKTLDVHIQRIRERIEENPKKPKRLMTIRGMGYKLIDE